MLYNKMTGALESFLVYNLYDIDISKLTLNETER